jgi:catechol 2,3-dioxygenase-like lactoylglutathione lyase family enzyme
MDSTKPIGIHHVTAIAGDPQRNLDFYEGVLGLRLVKKTVNFDDPTAYHLYYGDGIGSPGTIMTFFSWPGAPKGSRGSGQMTATSFAVPGDSLDYWMSRLSENGVAYEEPVDRFGEQVLTFEDPDGLRLELVAGGAPADGEFEAWRESPVPVERAIRGFHVAVLSERDPRVTAKVLTEALGARLVGEEGERSRYAFAGNGAGSLVDVIHASNTARGRVAVGTVHHVAWRVRDYETHETLREEITSLGYNVTPVIDRQYFHAIYFREPGGVLFEVATDPPGFTLDESPEELGTALKLPEQHEPLRKTLEASLPEIKLPRFVGGASR